MSKKIRMSFKQNLPSTFRPAIDTFGGRGNQGGLTHGGQYSVDYILAEDAKKNKAKITPFLKDTPPVATPVPTKQEKARMRTESVATPVPKKQEKARMRNASGESFKNIVSGNEREEIRELLKGYSCFTKPKDGYYENCNGLHAMWQVSQGNCEGANDALDKLQRCADSFFGDASTSDGAKNNLEACTNRKIDLSGVSSSLDKKKKNEILMGYAAQYRSQLEANKKQCELNRVEGGGFTYGCMQEEAENYNPQANREDGSCKFSIESPQPDGTFYENQGLIDEAIQPYLDGYDKGANYGGTVTMPAEFPPQKQAGFSMNPLLLIGALVVAGLVMFMANRPAPQITQTV
jgi:hypothetical protein